VSQKHTPGPWFVDSLTGVHVHIDTPASRRRVALACKSIQTTDEEERANARLIAAAPELLEACKEVIATSIFWPKSGGRGARFEGTGAAWRMLERIIEKAEGRQS
jgi:hypothetical protein